MNPLKLLKNVNSWEEFKLELKPLNTKEKGDCFEYLVKYYLEIIPTYKTQLKKIWILKEVPPNVKQHLNLPDSDQGIDLIAETNDQKYWAIQCKYREDESGSLTRGELSTFPDLAFNICKNIDFGLICTSVNRLSHTLTMYQNTLGYCCGNKWRELDENFFRQLHEFLEEKKLKFEPLIPWPHQETAIKNAIKYFLEEQKSRGKLIMPCGSGKSLVAFWIAQSLQAQKIVIAVPSLSLIRQTLEVWARESLAVNKNYKWIIVCSDETVTESKQEDITIHIQDLGVHVETDEEAISAWLTKNKDSPQIIFTTYQSGKKLSTAAKLANFSFDLGIFDEAHKTVGRKDRLFSFLLFNSNLAIKRRLFMTATERFYRGTSDEISSMDRISDYGEIFMRMSFLEAIESKPPVLSDYKIVTIVVSQDEITELIKKNILVKPDRSVWNKKLEARGLASLIALRKAMKKYQIRHTISFHRTIEAARTFKISQDNFSQTYPEYESLETFHVSGEMPSSMRSQYLSLFESSERSLISNAKCLSEGVDIPNIDCVLFADPKNSVIDIVQAVGRALRRAKGKDCGYVLVPVLVDDLNDPHLDQEEFQNVITILRALGSSDERIIEYFEFISNSEGGVRPPGPVEWDFPEQIINPDEFISSLELNCWKRINKLVWRPFWEAREFVHKLKLKSKEEWISYCEGKLAGQEECPSDIPPNPSSSYAQKGWIDINDWLGNLGFFPFSKAREIVHTLNLKSKEEWEQFCENKGLGLSPKVDDIPSQPDLVYRWDGWLSWDDWLKASGNQQCWRSFDDALKFVKLLNLTSHSEWEKYCKGDSYGKISKPKDIPSNPDQVYIYSGWLGWKDWLCSDRVNLGLFSSFQDARIFVRDLKITKKNWWLYCNGQLPQKGIKPEDIPSDPDNVYAEHGWVGWGDWFHQNRNYLSYIESITFVHQLGLTNHDEWVKYCAGKLLNKGTKPKTIPADPAEIFYQKGWKGWADWLGPSFRQKTAETHYPEEAKTNKKAVEFWMSFEEARDFSRKLNLFKLTNTEWKDYCNGKLPDKKEKPVNIPKNPEIIYKNSGWVSFTDWLQEVPNWIPYQEAQEFVWDLKLINQRQWKDYCNGKLPDKKEKPVNIPKNPETIYKNSGWVSYRHWLGIIKIYNV
jgi:superfamily II DNA or RNA helicase